MGTSRLKVILVERDMSVLELAEKTGLSARSISRFVNGHTTPTINNAYKISDILGLHITKVFPNVFNYKRISRNHF